MTEYLDADGDPMIFPPDMPEEMKASIAAQAQRAGMVRADVENRMSSFFGSLDQEQMQSLRIIFGQITRQPALSHYFEGIAVGALTMKFGVGGFTMDPALLGKSSVPGTEPIPAAEPPLVVEAGEAIDEPPANSTRPPIHPSALAAQDQDAPTVPAGTQAGGDDQYALYNVRPIAGSDEVECIGCGLVYVSLADRMVKAPDDCHGCQNKAAWG